MNLNDVNFIDYPVHFFGGRSRRKAAPFNSNVRDIMKQKNKLIISVLLSSIITAAVVSSLAIKGTNKALINKFREVEIFNEVGRVEIWGNIEELLEKGCSKKALLYIKNEKASVLSGLNNQVGNNHELLKVSEERKSSILKLMKNNNHSGFFQIPTCK